MYADIVVFTPTDPAKNFFTYKIPNILSKDIVIDHNAKKAWRSVSRSLLEIGQLVSVPWGKKTSQGIIIETKKETNVKNPKEILKILSPRPILLPNYIELLKWMSWYYHAPMLDCLKAMLPELPRNAKRLMTNSKSFNRLALEVKQTLFLVPTINQINQVLSKLKRSKGILIYHKQLPKKELWESWWTIYNENIATIIGTRSALFTQCPNLSEIRILNEEEPGFGNPQSPYFDTLTVADKLAQIAKAKLVIESLTPRVETFFRFLPRSKKPKIKAKPKVTIVDLRKLVRTFKKSDISDTLRDLVIDKVKKNQNVLLFLNRIKESGQIYCAECKFSGYSPSPPEFCPNCKGKDFSFYSLNINSLKGQVLKLAPHVGMKVITERTEKMDKRGKPVLTLGTSAIFSQKQPKFSLVGIVLADTILNLPDFNSSFRTFATIVKLTQLADRDGEVLVQTYNPQHLAIKAALNFEFEDFYQEELILRKKLELPPFATLAKLSLKMKNVKKAQDEAERLKSALEARSLLVEVSDPVQNWQGKAEFNIIVKAKKRDELDSVLPYVPAKWKVEVDPESLL